MHGPVAEAVVRNGAHCRNAMVMVQPVPVGARTTICVGGPPEYGTTSIAAAPWRSQVRVLDMNALFTPGDRFRDAMEVDGAETIVREPDGIHLNQAGSALAAEVVEEAIDQDFTR